jgi:carbon-monoxide dehydrogenase medium subunit
MQFLRARTLDEGLRLLGEIGDEARLLAGGTDVMVQYLHGEIAPGALVHIEGIADLATISHNGRTVLGPLVTHRTLATDETVATNHPALAAAARTVGGWQTQAVGTVGGNICNASPAADTAPPLLTADAVVTIASEAGERRVPLDEFFVDRRRTVLGPDEMVTAIDVEPLPSGSGETYLKLGRRGAMEVALAGVAVRLAFDPDGAVTSARVAVCSVAPIPGRVTEAEAALLGSRLDPEALDAAGEALRRAASPIDDARASASYRVRILRGLLGRAVEECREVAAR